MGGSVCISPMRAPSAIGASSVRLRFAEGSAVATERAGAGGASGRRRGRRHRWSHGRGHGRRHERRHGRASARDARPGWSRAEEAAVAAGEEGCGGAAISHSRDSICASSRPWARAVMAGSHPLRSARAAARVSVAAEIDARYPSRAAPLSATPQTAGCSRAGCA